MKTIVKKLCPKRRTLGMAVLAASLQFSSFANAESIGDLDGYGEDSYFAEDAAYDDASYQDSNNEPADVAPQAYQQVGHQEADYAPAPESNSPAVGSGYYEPIGADQMADRDVEQVGFFDNMRHRGSSQSCDMMTMGGCDSYGCDSGCGGGSNCGAPTTWATMEALLWFVEDREPGLMAVQFNPATLAVTDRFESIDSGLAPGFRADVGTWMTDNLGFGGRYTQIYDGNESGTYNPGGDGLAIGVPFLDPDFGNDTFLIDINRNVAGAIPRRRGELRFEEEVDYWMAEAYGRVRFSAAKHHSLDFLGGYSHMELDNDLQLQADIALLDNAIAPIGTREFYQDNFDTENEFNGGQVGFEAVVTRGRWMARSLTKVHMGNMSQTVSRFGRGTRTEPGFGPTDLDGGIFGPGQRETVERDVFAFIPEANFKLGYRMTNNAYLTAGYSFLYLDNVALASSALSTNVSPPGAPFENGPALAIQDDSLYLHGVDVGLVLDF